MKEIDRVAIVVDGRTEILAFRDRFMKDVKKCPGLLLGGCNGREVSAQSYVERVLPTVQVALSDRYNHIVCVLDREQRNTTATSLAAEIRQTLITAMVNRNEGSREELEKAISVCVADRMFENWIVADVEGLKKARQSLIKAEAKQDFYEGQSGVTALTRMLTVRYLKCTHGPLLFKSIRVKVARRNSASYDDFCRAVIG